MSKAKSIMSIVFAIVVVILAIGMYLTFHGYLDSGQFEVKDTKWHSASQVAIIAKRSDHQALDGDQYFILISDHVPSAQQLRRAYYEDGLVFRAGSDCLSARWEDSHNLVISCPSNSIQADEIAVQKHESANIVIFYEGIPMAK
jgi:hypothetical protein